VDAPEIWFWFCWCGWSAGPLLCWTTGKLDRVPYVTEGRISHVRNVRLCLFASAHERQAPKVIVCLQRCECSFLVETASRLLMMF
jgi:hypothetical protein